MLLDLGLFFFFFSIIWQESSTKGMVKINLYLSNPQLLVALWATGDGAASPVQAVMVKLMVINYWLQLP